MAKKDPFQFFNLPTELRLEVYRHLLTDALADGHTSDAGGLYRACRTTNSEMETLVSTVRIALNLKHAWKLDRRAFKGNLRFELPPGHSYATPLAQVAISIPCKPKHTTRKAQVTHALRKHVKQTLALALNLLVSPLGYELRGRLSPEECLASDYLFFRFFIIICGKRFLKETANSGNVEQLIFYKDPLEDKWVMKVTYVTSHRPVEAGSKRYGVYWDVDDESESRVFGFDFKVGFPILDQSETYVNYDE